MAHLATRLRPGANGFPLRGDASFEAATLLSNSDFETESSFFMTSLNAVNSDEDSKADGAGFMLPHFTAFDL